MKYKNKKLYELLYRNRVALTSKEFKNLLLSIESLIFHEFVDNSDKRVADSKERVDIMWRAVVRYDTIPTSKIYKTSPEADLSKWVRACLTIAKIKDDCYIFASDFDGLPWAGISVDPNGEWLFSLWKQLSSLDMMIMSANQNDALIFLEEEHWFEAHVKKFADV